MLLLRRRCCPPWLLLRRRLSLLRCCPCPRFAGGSCRRCCCAVAHGRWSCRAARSCAGCTSRPSCRPELVPPASLLPFLKHSWRVRPFLRHNLQNFAYSVVKRGTAKMKFQERQQKNPAGFPRQAGGVTPVVFALLEEAESNQSCRGTCLKLQSLQGRWGRRRTHFFLCGRVSMSGNTSYFSWKGR